MLRAGHIVYIADKNSHSILRIAPDGTIQTHAGTHTGGFNGDGPAAATDLNLNFPNGEWVRADGIIYVFDTDNGRIRRVNTNHFKHRGGARVTPSGRKALELYRRKEEQRSAAIKAMWTQLRALLKA